MAVQGYIGQGESQITFASPVSINCTLGAGIYPNGTITFDNISDGNAYWKNNNMSAGASINLYLCDSAGNNKVLLFTVSLGAGQSNTTVKAATISGASALAGKALYLVATGDTNVIQLRRYTTITINTDIVAYDVIVNAGAGGTASANKAQAKAGETVTITSTPNSGYAANTPTASGITFTSAGTNKWTFTMPSGGRVAISCTFTRTSFNISYLGADHGAIAVSKQTAAAGETITVTLTPDTGYKANTPTSSPSVTMTSAGTNKWTFTMPSSDITINASFSKVNYALTGSVSPSGTGTVSFKKGSSTVTQAQMGDTVTVVATPNTGYKVKSITTSPSRTVTNNAFTMPASAVTVTVTFEKITYTVSVSAGTGGTLTADKATAQMGDTVTLTRTANTGYQFSSWTKTPSDLSINASTLKFTMPAQNVSVKANFSKIDYAVTVNAGTGGTATVSKNPANYNDVITITATPNTGYKVKSITTSPSRTITDNKFTMPASAVTVTVTFEKISYTITGSAGSGGTVSLSKSTANYGDTITVTASPGSGYTANTPTASGITFTSAGANKWTFTMPAKNVTVSQTFSKIPYTVSKTVTPSGSGTATLSKTTAYIGDEITVTATPATGYKLKSIVTSPARTVTNNKFTMPASNVAVTVTFEKVSYSLSGSASPAAGGTVTLSKAAANYGDSITVSQTPATGYYFNGWTKTPSSLVITNGTFSMPAQNVTLVANYLKRSTATLASKSLTGGGTVKLTISADKTTYTHKYKLNMGTNMETEWIDVAAGVTEVTISVPDSWSNQIPNATQKTGGLLTVRTYNGSTMIGYYTISGITYNVRSSAVPTLNNITKSIVRTVGGTTYANVGDYYVQNKSAVRVQDTAAGVLGSSITKIEVTLSSYSGNDYKKTVNNSTTVDWTSGLLNIAGTITITVVATDSRGRTATKTTTFTVTAYTKPKGTLSTRRVDADGNDDVLGTYGKYTKTSSYTAVGSNSLTVTLSCQGTTATNPANEGNLMPSSRKTFDRLTEYTVTMTLADTFETVTITAKLPTAQFMIFVNALGDRLGLMKATNESLSKNGKTGTIEFSENHQVYIGTEMLEAFIKRVMHLRPAIQIPENSDFDDYYEPGEYYVQNSTAAATIDHIPETGSGGRLMVDVDYGTSATNYIRHTYYVGGSSRNIYVRKTDGNGEWNAWYRISMTAV